MSIIDEVLAANGDYSKSFKLGSLAMPPSRRLAIVACMDARTLLSKIRQSYSGPR